MRYLTKLQQYFLNHWVESEKHEYLTAQDISRRIRNDGMFRETVELINHDPNEIVRLSGAMRGNARLIINGPSQVECNSFFFQTLEHTAANNDGESRLEIRNSSFQAISTSNIDTFIGTSILSDSIQTTGCKKIFIINSPNLRTLAIDDVSQLNHFSIEECPALQDTDTVQFVPLNNASKARMLVSGDFVMFEGGKTAEEICNLLKEDYQYRLKETEIIAEQYEALDLQAWQQHLKAYRKEQKEITSKMNEFHARTTASQHAITAAESFFNKRQPG